MLTGELVEVPLGLRLRFPGDRRLDLDLSGLPGGRVVRELAQALAARTNTNGPIASPVTARSYGSAIRHLARHLGAHGFDAGAAELTEAQLFDYWQTAPPRYEAATRILLADLEATTPGLLQPKVVAQLGGVRLAVRRRSQPRLPYSVTETARLLGACRAVVAAAEARMAAAAELLDADDDDAAGPTVALARFLDAQGPHSAAALARLPAAATPASMLPGPPSAAAVGELCEALFPTAELALAMRVLVGLATGICPEGVDGLRVDAMEWVGREQVRIRWHKARGGGAEAHVFASRGPWSPGRLIGRWLALSARARRFAPSSDAMWLCCDGAHRRLGPAAFSWDTRHGFVARHGLLDDDGRPLGLRFGALRASYFAAYDRHWNGAVRIDPNHSARVEADHYLGATTAPAPLEATIEAAQRDLLHKAATAALTVLDDDELAALVDDPAAAAARLHMKPDDAAAVVGGERDVFVAACKDFYHSPHGRPGQACPSPVWTCLSCPLAVFTPGRLPNLLRLRDHLEARWAELATSEWMALYGPAQVRLDRDILPQFTPATLAAARASLATAGGADDNADADADGLYLAPEHRSW